MNIKYLEFEQRISLAKKHEIDEFQFMTIYELLYYENEQHKLRTDVLSLEKELAALKKQLLNRK